MTMGLEYELRFADPEPEAIAELLRQIPQVSEMIHAHQFEWRAERSASAMADAAIHIEPYGVYFCDYGGQGRDFFGTLVSRLVGKFGAVTVEEIGD